MKTKSLHIIISLWAICLACASCSQEDITQPVSAGDGQVRIVYKVAGTSLSRAPEPGWGDEDNDGTDKWHENIINRIDLFVFNRNNETLFKHIASSGNLNVDANSEQTFTQNELTYDDVANGDYIYYMVANCEFDDNDMVEGTFTLDDLKKKTTLALTFNDEQISFAMDGKIENVPEPVDNVITLSFKLNRAAAKIRVSVNNGSQTSIIQRCQFQLFNYVEKGTSVLSEAEAYGETDRRESMTGLTGYSEMLPFNKEKVIFYSYPNDWFDEGRVKEYVDDEDNKNGNWVIDNYASEIPIIGNKQTYILLKAPFNNTEYYYKVPVNYAIYEDNDAVWFTDEQIEEIHDLYRIKRNHIYDITVTIDREGGITEDDAVTLNLNYQVADWGEEDITIPDFE